MGRPEAKGLESELISLALAAQAETAAQADLPLLALAAEALRFPA